MQNGRGERKKKYERKVGGDCECKWAGGRDGVGGVGGWGGEMGMA